MKLLTHSIKFINSVIVILLVFIVSCSNENEYKTALKAYVEEDFQFHLNRKAYEIAHLKVMSEERPREFKAIYEEAEKINSLVSNFENYLLKAEDVSAINIEFKKFKEAIFRLKLKNYKFLEKGFSIKPIKSISEKYKLISKLKNLNFDSYNLMFATGCNLSIDDSQILASRLNDSIVVLNVFSEILRDYRISDNNLSLDVVINKTMNGLDFIGYYVHPNSSSAAYLIKSKSDTLFVDAIIKTDDVSKLIIEKNSSPIVVGELKEFDENYLEDYFKKTYN